VRRGQEARLRRRARCRREGLPAAGEFAVKISPIHTEADGPGPFIRGGAPAWGMAFVLQFRSFPGPTAREGTSAGRWRWEFAVKIARPHLEPDAASAFIAGGAPAWGMEFLQYRDVVGSGHGRRLTEVHPVPGNALGQL